MELLDRYLHALKTYLPKDQHRDIIEELSDTIQSEAEAQERSLGRPLNRAEEEALLKRFGHPMLVAGRYRPQQYLIGPALFPFFLTALKLAVALLLLLHVVIAVVVALSSETPTASGLGVLKGLWTSIVFWVGLITLAFAILERYQIRPRFLDNWSPSDLPDLPSVAEVTGWSFAHVQRVPWSESIPGLVLGTVVLLYWLGVPPLDKIAFGGDGVTVRLAPEWARFQTPITVILLMGVVQNGISLARPYWTSLRALTRVVIDAIALITLSLLLRSDTLVRIVDAAGDSARFAEQAAILNRVFSVGLKITAGVFVVDALLNLWRLFRGFRRP